ncbi:MAG: hypothetical protein PHH00_03780 [Candidatus Nanoarchaeia archaeon]|nr:hypothetical protein [Candidatus Nanoarchaeia archaeon]
MELEIDENKCMNCGSPCEHNDDFCCDKCRKEYLELEKEEKSEREIDGNEKEPDWSTGIDGGRTDEED